MSDEYPPQPPENPFETPAPDSVIDQDQVLPQSAPNVAAQPGKALVVLGIAGAAIMLLLYFIFFGGNSDKKPKEPKEIKVDKTAIEPPVLPNVVDQQTPLPPPGFTAPSLPEPVDLPKAEELKLGPIEPREDQAQKQQAKARMKSNMMVVDGGSTIASNPSGPPGAAGQPATDPNSQFTARTLATKVETATATRILDLHRTIAQGRIIHATLETAINTDLTAPIRAIVSRDTYGEAGTAPLIPKGSRLIGQYNSTLNAGQTRVLVIWTRVIRPDGVDVMIGSPLVDGIGQAGIAGQIDTKFQELFSRSLLSSVMNIAMAIGSEKMSDSTSVTTSSGGATQTTGGAAQEATTNALNRLGAVTDGFIQRFMNVPPTILIDQGSIVNVMVNKDVVFPADVVGNATVQ